MELLRICQRLLLRRCGLLPTDQLPPVGSNAAVELRPTATKTRNNQKACDDDDACSLIENCCIKACKQQRELGHPPQKTDWAVRVHVVFTLLMFALATTYRRQCEQEATGGPVGWQRWRRHFLEKMRELVIVFAQGAYGIFHLAEYSLLVGVKLKDVPPAIGTQQDILTKYRRISQA
jgi:hypothetical protein